MIQTYVHNLHIHFSGSLTGNSMKKWLTSRARPDLSVPWVSLVRRLGVGLNRGSISQGWDWSLCDEASSVSSPSARSKSSPLLVWSSWKKPVSAYYRYCEHIFTTKTWHCKCADLLAVGLGASCFCTVLDFLFTPESFLDIPPGAAVVFSLATLVGRGIVNVGGDRWVMQRFKIVTCDV